MSEEELEMFVTRYLDKRIEDSTLKGGISPQIEVNISKKEENTKNELCSLY